MKNLCGGLRMKLRSVIMENKYNVGEPVCVYGCISAIADDGEGGLEYTVVMKNSDGRSIDRVSVPEDLITTVF